MAEIAMVIRPNAGSALFVSRDNESGNLVIAPILELGCGAAAIEVFPGEFQVKDREGLFRLRVGSEKKSPGAFFRSTGWIEVFWDDVDIVRLP